MNGYEPDEPQPDDEAAAAAAAAGVGEDTESTRRAPAWRALAVTSFLVATLLLAAFAFSDGGLGQLRRARDRQRRLTAEVTALEAQNARIGAEIERLRNDPAAIEKLAREDLGLVKPGEIVVMIPEPSPVPAASTPRPR